MSMAEMVLDEVLADCCVPAEKLSVKDTEVLMHLAYAVLAARSIGNSLAEERIENKMYDIVGQYSK